MKTYYITSDIHSFYSELRKALTKKGFKVNNKNHILIICGDAFDRGLEAKELLKFLLKLKKQNRLIYIKGNHEWLMEDLLDDLKNNTSISYYHYTNGTLGTLSQLCNINIYDLLSGFYNYNKIMLDMKDYFKLVKDSKFYYEIDDYIFVHGWIPHIRHYEDLKDVHEDEWKRASWLNGMLEWNNGWRFNGKTIVCGHFHTSYGNYHYHGEGSGEFEEDSCFESFIDYGIIALDACTAYSHKVNIIKINEKGEII